MWNLYDTFDNGEETEMPLFSLNLILILSTNFFFFLIGLQNPNNLGPVFHLLFSLPYGVVFFIYPFPEVLVDF